MSVCRRRGLIALGAIITTAPALRAQGFGLNEISSCAVARGFAATAAPCDDGSYLFWNPAAGTQLAGTVFGGGGAAIAVSGGFTQDVTRRRFDSAVPTQWPPHAFLTRRVRPGLALGLGVYVPYGLASQWGEDFPGRFVSRRATLSSIYIQPTVSYDVVPGTLSLGAGAVIARTAVTLDQSLDLSQQVAQPAAAGRAATTFAQFGVPLGTEFGRARLTGSSIGYGVNLGARWTPMPALAVGARYLSSVRVSLSDGEARFTAGTTGLVLPRNNPLGAPGGTTLDQLLAPQFAGTGALTAQAVSTEFTMPDQLSVGAAWTGIKDVTLSADVIRLGWQSFETVTFDFANAATPDRTLLQDYTASWSVRGGAERRFANGWIVRGGASWTQSPAPAETVTPLLPDQDRRNLAVGVGIPLSGLGTRWRLDASYLFVDSDGRRGRTVERFARTETADALNTGVYSLRAHVASLTLRASW